MLFEIMVQALLGVLAIYFSIMLLYSRVYWKIIIGFVLMAAGIAFTMTTGEIIMFLMGIVPAVGTIKALLIPVYPYAVGASFIAWLGYMGIAYSSRIRILGLLWKEANTRINNHADHLEVAKNRALSEQFVWLIVSFAVSLVALAIAILSWVHQDFFAVNMYIMIIALTWVFVVPPLVIHTILKKPDAIEAIKNMKGLLGVDAERMNDYRELIAVMEEIKDPELRDDLDELIINGLAQALSNKNPQPKPKQG